MSVSDMEFVISGISGRFPMSNNLEELWSNLNRRKDMISDLKGNFTGKLANWDQFDAEFFKKPANEVDSMDPRERILLELAHEVILDAGLSQNDIQGSNIGVFVGCTNNEDTTLGKTISRALGLSEISHSNPNDLPDGSIALLKALEALKNGLVESALVSGIEIIPASVQTPANISPTGKCRPFDDSADGTVQTEAAVAILICRKDSAKRSYATIVNVTSNPAENNAPPEEFLRKFYQDSSVNPVEVAYVEANGTGVKAEDEQEGNLLAKVFTEGRDKPLLIGSIKSNMGHTGSAAGLVGLIKTLLMNHQGQIPQNLKFERSNTEIAALVDGRLKVVSECTNWDGSYAAINAITTNGTNVHILLKMSAGEKILFKQPPLPVLVPISGRTPEGLEYQMKQIQIRWRNTKFVAIVHEAYKIDIPQNQYRGYFMGSPKGMKTNPGPRLPSEKSPLWFVFTGLGNQWVGMTKDMVRFKTFNDSIQKSARILKEKENYDLLKVLESANPTLLEDFKASIAAITTVQIALVDLLSSVGVTPDGIVGYSTGECCAGYSDGCFTAEQALLVSFSRARAFTESNLPPGTVAAVKLTWEEAQRRCPKGIYPAIHNSGSIVSISGPPKEIRAFIAQLTSERIFAKEVKSAIYGFHSPLVAGAETLMRELLSNVITDPKPRSKKWISTSIPAKEWGSDLAKYSSVDYHVNNALCPVFFFATLKHIPRASIVVEVGPHGFMQAILNQGVQGSLLILALMDQEEENTFFFANSLGKLYLQGVDVHAGKLYEPVSFPVDAGTPILSSMIKWDHRRSWKV